MILHVKKDIPEQVFSDLVGQYDAFTFNENGHIVVITSSAVQDIAVDYDPFIVKKSKFSTDIQLASRDYLDKTRTVDLGAGAVIGGETNNTAIIAGPCSIESEEQIDQTARFIKSLGIKVLRAGAYKPRTSPYTFKGMGLDGLKLLKETGQRHGLSVITEARDSTHIQDIIEYSDIVQIGAKAMYDHGILNACGDARKPVLLKRGFGTTLQEFVQAAEFILSRGNSQVVLCERGIRTFETKTRFTLDLCGAAYLKYHTNLPIILDPSHAIGYAYGVPDLTRACLAMGVDGILIETHPDPKVAKSDASQQLNFEQFEKMYNSLKPIASAIGRNII